MRAQFMLMLDMLRDTAHESADSMDSNYRWYHPAPSTLSAAVGSSRMWERKPDGKDLNFGVVRVGVGMTRPEVTWGEPQNMPTDIELEPVTGKALQEFGRYQSVVYNLPKMVSLLVEPWYSLIGEREQVLDLMRAIVCQLAFSHGPDHVQMIVVTSDLDEWDWVKWLPHFGDPRRQDAAGNARMVYSSVREFAAEQAELFAGRGSFTPRHASSSVADPDAAHVIIADVDGSAMGVRDQLRRRRRGDVLRPDRLVDVVVRPGADAALRQEGRDRGAAPRPRHLDGDRRQALVLRAHRPGQPRRGRGVRAEAGALATRRGLRRDRPAGGPHRRPRHPVVLRR